MYKITIIIPVYNVEKYISKCLDTICNQCTDEIQVVCVDDCSTDNSYDIVQTYCKKYSNIELYQNKVNLGLAATRNVGVEKANGDYIMFVDSDDYIAENALQCLINELEKDSVDVLSYSTQMFWDTDFINDANLDRRIRVQNYSAKSGVELMCDFIRNDEMFGAAWGAIYKRKYLVDSNIKFIEGILHEDIPFMFKVFLNAPKAKCINKIIYFYRQRNDSILNKPDYNRLIEGLVVGYMDMIYNYHKYSLENYFKNQIDECVIKYLDAQMSLIEDRYEKLIVQGAEISKPAIKYFMKKIHKAKELDTCFEEQDISFIKNSDKLVLYGAGCIATRIMTILIEKKISVHKIYVTSRENNPEKFFGINVYEFDPKVVIENNEALIVGVSIDNSAELIENIKAMGIRKFIRTIAR